MKSLLVITPTLFRRHTIKRTVQSVLPFVNTQVQHVIISPVYIHSFFEKYPHLAFIKEPELSGGIFPAVNYVLELLYRSYDYFAYLNDDDYWTSNVQSLFDVVNEKSPDLAIGRTLLYKSHELSYVAPFIPSSRMFTHLALCGKPPFTQQSIFFRTVIIDKIGFFNCNLNLNADTEYIIRCQKHGFSFSFTRQICSVYSLEPNRLTSNQSLMISAHEKLLSLHKRHWFSSFLLILYLVYNTPLYIRRCFSCIILLTRQSFLNSKKV